MIMIVISALLIVACVSLGWFSCIYLDLAFQYEVEFSKKLLGVLGLLVSIIGIICGTIGIGTVLILNNDNTHQCYISMYQDGKKENRDADSMRATYYI